MERKMIRVGQDLAQRHYAEHVGTPCFEDLDQFITTSPLAALVVEGEEAIDAVRALMGNTSPVGSAPGTIRGDLAVSIGLNLVHGSDSAESARREVALFFSEDEILTYERDADRWIIES